ncbi:Gfo/Idh/MocA family oxidoreductase [Agromyces intestinalis]|uniref:Gfo/Idh/MocA family oxidoreductase n=1 Tax=Agromyces intestinalis TaxID=2592652 RepID=A0A5C1YER8_9MICO|nr:Gfo/Idh/MocA family oxidoreductase [Agromyces intestinalis]QEO13965.1 Gfo/Idh/MocA family oxidoreductase [Agromyces intestinalis]
MTAPLPRIGVAGIHGHGATHVAAARALEASGRARLVAVADHRPPEVDLGDVAVFHDATDLITRADLDVVVLSTPMHTHLPLAYAALEAGVHVLLEKPPTPSLADFRTLVDASEQAGRAVQVGFQSLGSKAVPFVRSLVAGGTIGQVERYGALGTWLRTESYWTRAPWAGRRTLDGRAVVDGAVTNPLAHATATALAVADATTESDVTSLRLDLHRANAIDADDTSSYVAALAGGRSLAGALVLTAPRRSEPCVIVHGSTGRIVLWYTLDLVQVTTPGSSIAWTTSHQRTNLLANLVDHVVDGVPLLVPLAATGGFMRVLEAVRLAPDPSPIAPGFVERRSDASGDAHLVVRDVETWSERVVAEGRTFAELGAPWA